MDVAAVSPSRRRACYPLAQSISVSIPSAMCSAWSTILIMGGGKPWWGSVADNGVNPANRLLESPSKSALLVSYLMLVLGSKKAPRILACHRERHTTDRGTFMSIAPPTRERRDG
jgi:hypothetical protein